MRTTVFHIASPVRMHAARRGHVIIYRLELRTYELAGALDEGRTVEVRMEGTGLPELRNVVPMPCALRALPRFLNIHTPKRDALSGALWAFVEFGPSQVRLWRVGTPTTLSGTHCGRLRVDDDDCGYRIVIQLEPMA